MQFSSPSLSTNTTSGMKQQLSSFNSYNFYVVNYSKQLSTVSLQCQTINRKKTRNVPFTKSCSTQNYVNINLAAISLFPKADTSMGYATPSDGCSFHQNTSLQQQVKRYSWYLNFTIKLTDVRLDHGFKKPLCR